MRTTAPTRLRPRARRTAVAALLCAAVATGAAACGPSSDNAKPAKSAKSSKPAKSSKAARSEKPAEPFADLTGAQLVDKAFAATKAAKSLTVDADLTVDAEPLKAYVSFDLTGKCVGTLTTGTAATTEIVRADRENVYMRFDAETLREQSEGDSPEEQEATIKALKGRWVELPASDPDSKDVTSLCDAKSLLDDLGQSGSGVTKGAATTVDGQKAIPVAGTDGKGVTRTVYVAAEGTPYVLKIVEKGGDEPGTVVFSQYGKPVTAKAPAAKDIADLG